MNEENDVKEETLDAKIEASVDVDDIDSEVQQLSDLKHRADVLGVKYHPNIGLAKLQTKISEALAKKDDAPEEESEAAVEAKAAPKITDAQREMKTIQGAKQRALQLVRARITCMDPSKKEYEGEVFSAGNSVVGTVKKYVPYETDWHIPRIILNMIRARQYQSFVTRVNSKGAKIKGTKLVRMYAIEELPPLSVKEMKELQQRQAMAKGTSEA